MKAIYPILALSGSVLSDVPIFCPYESSLGIWKYAIGTSGDSQEIVSKCGLHNLGTVTKYATFKLEERNKVTNLDTGSTGTYTIVSGQGFEMSIDGRKFWAYYNYEDNDCESTVVGYQRDDQLREWNCIQGSRIRGLENGRAVSSKIISNEQEKFDPFYVDPNFDAQNYWADKKEAMESQYYKNDQTLIEKINSQALTWTAKSYPEFEEYTLAEMQARQGFQPISLKKMNDRKYSTAEEKLAAAKAFKWPENAPRNFDWRNIEGKRFDSPVWDQMSCGSCFAFAAKSYMETMIRIQTNLQDQPVISAQEIITCGADENYNQGCSGGFAYLTGGKEAYERGVVAESCDPENLSYKSANSTVCPDTSTCRRYYATSYEYLGGYYGAATAEMMINHLWKLGPLSVGIAVVDDFRAYSEGIYYSLEKENGGTENTDPWNPLEATNHAVVIVGYGKCPSTMEAGTTDENGCVAGRDEDVPYWIVKNSWGEKFGEAGYIKVLLGIDEIYIESKPFVGTYA